VQQPLADGIEHGWAAAPFPKQVVGRFRVPVPALSSEPVCGLRAVRFVHASGFSAAPGAVMRSGAGMV